MTICLVAPTPWVVVVSERDGRGVGVRGFAFDKPGIIYFLDTDSASSVMLRTLRDAGPTVLVPAAWLVAAGAHRGIVGEDAIFIAHLVMAGFISAFALTGWSRMADGALRAWRTVLVAGLGVTVAGIAGFLLSSPTLLAVSIVGWMILPAAGLAYTGRVFDTARRVYYATAALSGAGAVIYVFSLRDPGGSLALLGLAAVGLGQTAGILDATVRSD